MFKAQFTDRCKKYLDTRIDCSEYIIIINGNDVKCKTNANICNNYVANNYITNVLNKK